MTKTEELFFGNRTAKLDRALKAFGKTVADLEQDVNVLKEWLKLQRHLPEITSNNMLTNILFLFKFSIEECKRSLDIYYSMRIHLSEIFMNRNPRLPRMKKVADSIFHVTMPKMTKEGYRVSYFTLVNSNIDFEPYDIMKYCSNFFEIKLQKDVMLGDIYVIDMSCFTFAHITKITPVHVKKLFAASKMLFKSQLKQVHVINVAPYMETLIKIVKQVVTPKLAQRIFAHSSSIDLNELIPSDMIPKDYGGTEYSLTDLRELWSEIFEENQYRFDEIEKQKVDENKRPTPLINDDFLGFHGNFKQLNVD